MISELVYTSAPQGLFPGNTGFAVVGCTRNMDRALCKHLENLSAYTPLYPHYDGNAWNNPVNCAHRIIQVNGSEYHILSRICFNGLDYTQRSNKLASHIAISADELPSLPSGPASVFFQDALFKDEKWRITTGYFENPPVLLDLNRDFGVCENWKHVTNDAGWAGVVAESYLNKPQKNIYLVFDPQKSKLNISLVAEVLSLLPVHLRWQMTFSTYFTELPAGVTCNLRFCLPSCDALFKAKQNPAGNLILDLTAAMPQAAGGDLVVAARSGKLPSVRVASPNIPAAPLPFPTPAQPPVIIRQNNGMMKAVTATALTALGILGIVFLVTKITDNAKIKNLQHQSTTNQEIAKQALLDCYRYLRFRIESLNQKRDVPKKSPTNSNSEELQNRIKTFIETNEPSKKTREDASDLDKQCEEKLSKQRQTLAELSKILEFGKQEQTLVADIGKYKDWAEQMAAAVPAELSSLSYNPVMDQEKINTLKSRLQVLQDDRKELEKWQTSLREKFPAKVISIALSWSVQQELLDAMKNKKTYSIGFDDLTPNAGISAVYWGKDEIHGENDVYSTKDKKLRLNISLKNKVLTIRSVGESSIDISNDEFSLRITDRESQKEQWLEFFITSKTKLFPDAVPICFSTSWYFPIPEEVKKLPMLSDMTAILSVDGKDFEMKLFKKQEWRPAGDLPVSDTVRKLHRQWGEIAKAQETLQREINKKKFPPEVKLTEAFTKYDKSPKKTDDTEKFIAALWKEMTLEKLGLQDVPEKYRNLPIARAKAAIEKEMGGELTRAWQNKKAKIRFQSRIKDNSWEQTVEIKEVAGGKQP